MKYCKKCKKKVETKTIIAWTGDKHEEIMLCKECDAKLEETKK